MARIWEIILYKQFMPFLENRRYNFNQTCCKDKDVPNDCMGNCRGVVDEDNLEAQKVDSRSLIQIESFCDKYKNIIAHCAYEIKEGK